MTQPHFARRRNSGIVLHIVTGVYEWQPELALTTECGIRYADVLEEVADRDNLPVTTCQRCIKILGWNYPRKA